MDFWVDEREDTWRSTENSIRAVVRQLPTILICQNVFVTCNILVWSPQQKQLNGGLKQYQVN